MKSLTSITFSRATHSQLKDIQSFYSSVGYTGPVLTTDTIFLASDNAVIVGAVRIVLEHNILILRGMQIAYSYQKKGIGSALLGVVQAAITGPCYCLPHEWLKDFYGKIGFVVLPPKKAPLFLQERRARYKKKYPHIIIMYRPYI